MVSTQNCFRCFFFKKNILNGCMVFCKNVNYLRMGKNWQYWDKKNGFPFINQHSKIFSVERWVIVFLKQEVF